MESKPTNTHNQTIWFGKYEGERWTRLPIGYIRWLINKPTRDPKAYAMAKSEMARRGDTMPSVVEISNHAIDKASIRLLPYWQDGRKEDEGLYSWLARICTEALSRHNSEKPERIHCKGYTLVFAYGDYYPTLKTVLKPNNTKELGG